MRAGEPPGLTYNQWLGNVLRLLGIAEDEYVVDEYEGYPYLYVGMDRVDFYPRSVRNVAGDDLPWLRP